jgi:hypothetical protein
VRGVGEQRMRGFRTSTVSCSTSGHLDCADYPPKQRISPNLKHPQYLALNRLGSVVRNRLGSLVC